MLLKNRFSIEVKGFIFEWSKFLEVVSFFFNFGAKNSDRISLKVTNLDFLLNKGDNVRPNLFMNMNTKNKNGPSHSF